MSKNWTFSNKESHSFILEANDFFILYSNPSIPRYYEANFLQLNYSPTLEEFIIIEEIYKSFQIENKQKHLKMNWPDNTGIHMDVLNYLNNAGYKIGKQELMALNSEDILITKKSEELNLEWVDEQNLHRFLDINYKEDRQYGKVFADVKQEVYRYIFDYKNARLLLATKNKQPVGSLIVILSDDSIEIDHVLTDRCFRNQGVASYMIKNVSDKSKHPVILAVDAEDTPKELYKKLGFEVVSTQISALKESVR